MLKIAMRQFGWLLINPKLYIAGILSMIGYVYDAIGLIRFSLFMNEPLNLWEPFLYASTNHISLTVTTLALIFLFSDMPYNVSDDTFAILRLSKGRWIMGKILFMVACCFLFHCGLFFLSACVSVPFSYVENVWSDPIYFMSFKNPILASENFHVYFYAPNIIVNLLPFGASLFSLFLNISYSIFYVFVRFADKFDFSQKYRNCYCLFYSRDGLFVHACFIQ